jgi:peptide/nickel transport system permease protein
VVIQHGLSNALLPVVTIVGLQLGSLLAGAILTETIFNLTGLGKTLYDAITSRDYIIVQGVTLIVAVTFVVINLLVDISYAFLDPRIRLS